MYFLEYMKKILLLFLTFALFGCLSERKKLDLIEFTKEGTGLHVLPLKTTSGRNLLIRNHIESYSISDKIKVDHEVFQRLVESAFPIKISLNSPYKLQLTEEPLATCTLIDSEKEILLVHCP